MSEPVQSLKKMPTAAATAIVLLSVVVCTLGLWAVVSGDAPERATRFGIVPSLEGAQALRYGSTVFLLGLLPLLAFSRSARTAAWLGSALAILLLGNLFFGDRIWR